MPIKRLNHAVLYVRDAERFMAADGSDCGSSPTIRPAACIATM